mmetsp:Transcript_5304/g.12294  ORF Transcript_5304/g.12294 Transcript_5304/m.12294 type:complete len:227 (+) Transcript_5304:322-1002(+)
MSRTAPRQVPWRIGRQHFSNGGHPQAPWPVCGGPPSPARLRTLLPRRGLLFGGCQTCISMILGLREGLIKVLQTKPSSNSKELPQLHWRPLLTSSACHHGRRCAASKYGSPAIEPRRKRGTGRTRRRRCRRQQSFCRRRACLGSSLTRHSSSWRTTGRSDSSTSMKFSTGRGTNRSKTGLVWCFPASFPAKSMRLLGREETCLRYIQGLSSESSALCTLARRGRRK